jgi:conjugal transfer/entry exclusion protein
MRKEILAIILSFMVTMGIAAQGYPVIDITNVVQSVQNGYTMVEQLHAMYSQIKTSYDQLQQQIKNFEAFDFSKLNARDPLGSWKSILTYADRMMTYEENIEAIINRKDIKIGDSTYSLLDLFTTLPNTIAQNISLDGLNFAFDPFEKRLSTEEKAAFHQKFGMSFGHYMRINHLGETLKKKSAEIVGYSESLKENLAEDREKLGEIVGDLFGSESIIQQQQINNAVMAIMAQDIKTLANIMGEIALQLAITSAQKMIEKQAMQEEITINDLDIPDGLIKILKDMPSVNMYK